MHNSNNKIDLTENVSNSTESAIKALKHLEMNLIQGGFKDAIAAYSMMSKTLIGQRGWAENNPNTIIHKNFREIAKTAGNIVDILKPYIENREKLRSLLGEDTLEKNELDQKTVIDFNSISSDKNQVINILNKQTRKQISYTNLRSTLGWERKKLDEILDLVAKNSHNVTIRNSGSRKMIILNS
jgi:hypothetical protein